jgi:hypothetical protein
MTNARRRTRITAPTMPTTTVFEEDFFSADGPPNFGGRAEGTPMALGRTVGVWVDDERTDGVFVEVEGLRAGKMPEDFLSSSSLNRSARVACSSGESVGRSSRAHFRQTELSPMRKALPRSKSDPMRRSAQREQ